MRSEKCTFILALASQLKLMKYQLNQMKNWFFLMIAFECCEFFFLFFFLCVNVAYAL